MMNKPSIDKEKFAEIILRAAIAIAFVYPAVDAFFNPGSWIGFFPAWMRGLAPDEIILLHLFGASEMIIAGWLLFAKRIFIPSVLASLYLVGIVAFNWRFIDLLFRDVSILGISLALALTHYRK
jgi:hypothetical protein